MQTEIATVETKVEWDNFVKHAHDANFLQSWEWGEFHSALGKDIVRLGVYQKNALIGICLGVVEHARRARYMTIAGGPLLPAEYWYKPQVLRCLFDAIIEQARRYSCSFVRMRAQMIDTPALRTLLQNEHHLRLSPMHLTADLTNQLELHVSVDELLQNMRKNTRYEVKKALKLGITVTTSSDPQDIDEFCDVQMETAKRQGFVPFSRNYLKKQFAAFAPGGNVLLYKACLEKELLAQAFVIFYAREAVYHYGASTDAGRKHPGAYLLQWEAICEAKRRGCERYNFWGVVPVEKTSHRFWGVSVFKRGFGGHEVHYVPAHDLVIDNKRYAVNNLIETVRRKIRHLD